MEAETLEHIGLGISLAIGLIVLGKYIVTGSVRTAKVYQAVEGDGVEPSLHAWREEVRDMLMSNVDDHRTLGRRLDEIQTELVHNGGTSVKDAVLRTERKLDDHLAAADRRQEMTVRHMLEIRQALESQGLKLPDPKEPPYV